MISNPKNFDKYLIVEGLVSIAPEHLKLLENMDGPRREKVMRNIAIEVYRLKPDEYLVTPAAIGIRRRLPITNSLSEDVLIRAAWEVGAAKRLIIETVRRELSQ